MCSNNFVTTNWPITNFHGWIIDIDENTYDGLYGSREEARRAKNLLSVTDPSYTKAKIVKVGGELFPYQWVS